MEVIEIYFEKIKGTATLVESSTLYGKWKIVVGNKYLIIQHSYIDAESYKLVEYSNDVDIKKAIKQVPVIMWQIDKLIKSKRPKPPKRYR